MIALRRLRTAVALMLGLALFTQSGGHLFVLQGVAWVKMLAAFSQSDTFTVAVQKTFDGLHPCKLCHEISRHKHRHSHDDEPARKPVPLKFDPFVLASKALSLELASVKLSFQPATYNLRSRSRGSPPTPPPEVPSPFA